MNKLITAYRAAPTFKNAQKIRAYDRAHPMARCMLTVEDSDLVADAIHKANSPQPKATPENIQAALEARFPGLKGKLIVM